jgi:carbon-monoxide dehydrogenase medium subunit
VTNIFAGPGRSTLSNDEVITAFRLRAAGGKTGSGYQRHTPRKIMDIAVVGVGVRLSLAAGGAIETARIALGAVAPTPIMAPEAQAALEGQQPSEELFARAAALAQQAASPISDVRGSAEFRNYLIGVMTKRCLNIALERAKGT